MKITAEGAEKKGSSDLGRPRHFMVRGGPMNGQFSDGIELVGASADIIGNAFIDLGRISIGTFPQSEGASTIRIIYNLMVGSGLAIPDGGDGIQVVGSANTINQFTIVNNTLANNVRFGIGFSLQEPRVE